jgi:hypothetical protein
VRALGTYRRREQQEASDSGSGEECWSVAHGLNIRLLGGQLQGEEKQDRLIECFILSFIRTIGGDKPCSQHLSRDILHSTRQQRFQELTWLFVRPKIAPETGLVSSVVLLTQMACCGLGNRWMRRTPARRPHWKWRMSCSWTS